MGGEACHNYRLDMTGSTYGVCVCGHGRAEHIERKDVAGSSYRNKLRHSSSSLPSWTGPQRSSFSVGSSVSRPREAFSGGGGASTSWSQRSSVVGHTAPGDIHETETHSWNARISEDNDRETPPFARHSMPAIRPANSSSFSGSTEHISSYSNRDDHHHAERGRREESHISHEIENGSNSSAALEEFTALLTSRCYDPENVQFKELPRKAQEGIRLIFQAAERDSAGAITPPPPPAHVQQQPKHSLPARLPTPQHASSPTYRPQPGAGVQKAVSAVGGGYASVGRPASVPRLPQQTSWSDEEEEDESWSSNPYGGRASAPAAPKGKSGPCDHYELDMLGATYGVCKCGHSRAAHMFARAF